MHPAWFIIPATVCAAAAFVIIATAAEEIRNGWRHTWPQSTGAAACILATLAGTAIAIIPALIAAADWIAR